MKMKKGLFVTASLFALSLASCGSSGYYATYQFQMGKANGTHIGIYMDLTKDKIEVDHNEGKETMEKFKLSFSLPSGEEEGDKSLVGGILTFFADGLYGGYKIEYSEELEKQHLTLVPVIDISALEKAIVEAMSGGDEESSSSAEPEQSSSQEISSSSEDSSSEEPFYIPSEFIDDILIATYSASSISITVPVSLTDLMYQLYWYGFDLLSMEEEQPLVHHQHGTHPTKEDIDKINETYNAGLIPHFDLDAFIKYKAVKTVEYRDFNQMTMTLVKADK